MNPRFMLRWISGAALLLTMLFCMVGISVAREPIIPPSNLPLHIVYTAFHDDTVYSYVMDSDGDHLRRLKLDGFPIVYPTCAPDGSYLAFMGRGGILYTIAADGTNLRRFDLGMIDTSAGWSVGSGGRYLAYLLRLPTRRSGIRLTDTTTMERIALTGDSQTDFAPAFSPDNRRVAYWSIAQAAPVIRIIDIGGTQPLALTTDGINPIWSPDANTLIYTSTRAADTDIRIIDVARRIDTRLIAQPTLDADAAWSPDGRSLVFVSHRDGNPEIYLADADGRHQRRLTHDSRPETSPCFLTARPESLIID